MLQKVPRAGWASCQEQISSEGEYVAVVKRMFSVEKLFSLTLSMSASRSSCVVFSSGMSVLNSVTAREDHHADLLSLPASGGFVQAGAWRQRQAVVFSACGKIIRGH